MDAQTQHRPLHQKPAGLNNILNKEDQPPSANGPPPQLRDSGFYSTAEASSKHTSAASFHVNGLSPGASGYQSSADKTPSPVAHNMATPQNGASPSASNMSVASMVSPTTPGSVDHRRHDRPTSLEHANSSQTTLGENMSGLPGSRRESVDSRINQGFSDMRLNANSPYASNNQSTTSIHNTLQAQRNPRPGFDALSVHRISNGYAPHAERNPESKLIRTAPAITGPATSQIARAAEPTKGQAWAFPEEEIQRVAGLPQYNGSRRSSITESIASSQMTAESRLPPGQRRLDETDYARMHKPSTDFSPMHHTLQHKQLSDLQAEDANGAAGSQPYSRTPELRVSHKLAERKRRTEMKELFDALRDEMPQERGSKASKWEILTKAINEHRAQKETIQNLSGRCHMLQSENEMLRHELQKMNMGMERGGQYRQEPQQHIQQQPPQNVAQAQGAYAMDQHYTGPNRTELPPLRSISNNIPNGPDSMTGIQFEGAAPAGAYR